MSEDNDASRNHNTFTLYEQLCNTWDHVAFNDHKAQLLLTEVHLVMNIAEQMKHVKYLAPTAIPESITETQSAGDNV